MLSTILMEDTVLDTVFILLVMDMVILDTLLLAMVLAMPAMGMESVMLRLSPRLMLSMEPMVDMDMDMDMDMVMDLDTVHTPLDMVMVMVLDMDMDMDMDTMVRLNIVKSAEPLKTNSLEINIRIQKK